MNLVSALEDLLTQSPPHGSTRVIAIDGRAGAGKTTLAQELFLGLSSNRLITVIHLDEIYDGWSNALGVHLTETLSRIFESLAREESFLLPIYNWATSSFDSEREISPCDLLILEGVGSSQAVVREFALATIWLDIDPALGLQRVLERDGSGISEKMVHWQRDEEELFIRDRTRENALFVLSTIG